MKLTYDQKHNVAYISLRQHLGPGKTVSVSNELNVDIAPDGKVYGIELLNANEQMQLGERPMLIIKNQSTGERIEVLLPKA